MIAVRFLMRSLCCLTASAAALVLSSPMLEGQPGSRTSSLRRSAASRNAGARHRPKAALVSLQAVPPAVTLQGRYSEARVLVTARFSDGQAQDVSGKTARAIAAGEIAFTDAAGIVRPSRDGKTVLTLRYGGRSVLVPIFVRGAAQSNPPRFVSDVQPVLTKAGCNQGSCHGAASGKGGFRLSLLGYDPELDYESITRAALARRVSPTHPENSLLLRKATLSVPHRGGLRFQQASPEFALLRDWIAGGMPGPMPSEPKLRSLEVEPADRTLAIGQTQQFIVRAVYGDGSRRDVTGETLFTTSDETVAPVTSDGEARAVGPGEGAVLIRYRDLVATARILSPFSPPRPALTNRTPAAGHATAESRSPAAPADALGPIDILIQRKLDALGLDPSPQCSDTDFLRRATLDVIGLLPTPEEIRAFAADRAPNKRSRWIDALLERPEYVDFWTTKWSDMLRVSRRVLAEKGMYSLYHWIRRSVAENKPWDHFGRELLLASGSTFENGPANFFRTAGTPQELAETTAQTFLGVRIQCARCHNHPYEKWTQNQYYQMSSFFVRVRSKKGLKQEEQDIYLASSGELKHPKTGKDVTPCALDAAPLTEAHVTDRRAALADWVTSPRNPFFAREIVNRLWAHFMGRGFVEPVDDLRVTNPPSNTELFAWLARDLVEHRFDLKHLMRMILLSRTYQRAAEPTRANQRDTRYYSHYLFKRLSAEQLMDALTAVTGIPEKFAGFPAGTRAAQLPDAGSPSYLLELFGRPARQTACACERRDEPNVGQVLHLINNAAISARIGAKTGRLAALLDAKTPDARLIEELYLAAVTRWPTPSEKRTALNLLVGAKDRRQAAEDLLWALINTKEFCFNH